MPFGFLPSWKERNIFFASFLLVSSYSLLTFGTRNSKFITRFKFTITLQKSTLSTYTAPVVVKVLYKSLWVLTTPLWGRWVSLSPFSVGKLRQRGKKSDLPKAVQGAELVFWWPQGSQTIQPQFPRLSVLCPWFFGAQQELLRVCNLKATCPQSSRESWTHTDLPAETTPALLWGQFSPPSAQSQNTGAAPTPDLSPAAFFLFYFVAKISLKISPRSGHLQHGSFHSLSSLSLWVCVST